MPPTHSAQVDAPPHTRRADSHVQPRIVITGMGVLAPNAHGLDAFTQALRAGTSGVRRVPELSDLKLGCQVAGEPQDVAALSSRYLSDGERRGTNHCITYACVAADDCWRDAGMPTDIPASDPDVDTGAIIGTGLSGSTETCSDHVFPLVDSGQARRLGTMVVERVMGSGPSARVTGRLGLAGPVTANSNACSTGAESIWMAAQLIRAGLVTRMMAGGSEGYSKYIVAMFDAMRLLMRDSNDAPEAASRPLSASAGGFVAAGGAGMLMLESLDSALARNAHIHAEFLGGAINCGGQRQGGTMAASSPAGVRRCLEAALRDARISPDDVDVVNGHFTGTKADVSSVADLQAVLGRPTEAFPWLIATKSLIGHALGAAGAIESVASVLMLEHGFVHGNPNATDLNPGLDGLRARVPVTTVDTSCRTLLKTSFGFGDVNCALLFRRWNS